MASWESRSPRCSVSLLATRECGHLGDYEKNILCPAASVYVPGPHDCIYLMDHVHTNDSFRTMSPQFCIFTPMSSQKSLKQNVATLSSLFQTLWFGPNSEKERLHLLGPPLNLHLLEASSINLCLGKTDAGSGTCSYQKLLRQGTNGRTPAAVLFRILIFPG